MKLRELANKGALTTNKVKLRKDGKVIAETVFGCLHDLPKDDKLLNHKVNAFRIINNVMEISISE